MKIITQNGDVLTGSEIHIQMVNLPKDGEDYVLKAKTVVGEVELFRHCFTSKSQSMDFLPRALHRTLVNLIKAGTEVVDIREIILQQHESNPQTQDLYRLSTLNGEHLVAYAKNIDQAIENVSKGNVARHEHVATNVPLDRFEESWQACNELGKPRF